MTDHETTNPPGPGNPPSSTSPADAGGAVLGAVPPVGREDLHHEITMIVNRAGLDYIEIERDNVSLSLRVMGRVSIATEAANKILEVYYRRLLKEGE